MPIMTITNPKTGRSNTVRAWNIDPKQVLADLRSGRTKSAKDLSWRLLSEKESADDIEESVEAPGDCARTNYALGIFEYALDWALGLVVLNFIRSAVRVKKLPKPFKVAANRKGDVFIITNSGRVLAR